MWRMRKFWVHKLFDVRLATFLEMLKKFSLQSMQESFDSLTECRKLLKNTEMHIDLAEDDIVATISFWIRIN